MNSKAPPDCRGAFAYAEYGAGQALAFYKKLTISLDMEPNLVDNPRFMI